MDVRLVTFVLAILVASFAAAPLVHAADVDAQDPSRWIRVKAVDGEANRVTLSAAGGVVTIADASADLVAGPGCEQAGAREVRCTIVDGVPRVDVTLGDGDDATAVLGVLPVKLDGGAGHDALTGGDAGDKLDGGDGDDRLSGGGGVDDHDGGEGDDSFATRDSTRENVVCGGGHDGGEADLEDDVAADCEGVAKPLAPPPLATPPGTPAPVPAQSVAASVKGGVVLARPPGSTTFAPLDVSRPLAVGTVLDARNGTVALTAAADRAGATQTADFTGGRFAVRQVRTSALTTVLSLSGSDFSSCRTATASRATAGAAASRRTIRRLWGSGKGRFRTRGRSSAATVRGTIWTVADRCDGTLTRVTRGVVIVENLRTHRTKVVRAGESFFVPRRKRRR